MKAFVLVLASIFFAPVSFSQTKDSASAKKIKILSWNIYMLPGWLGHGNIPRAEAIGKVLASEKYDVIVFQEAFHKKARKTINRLLQPVYLFQAGPANQKLFSIKLNSGLWIFSKFPILDARSIIFDARSGIDAMSRKGALMVEINVDGQPIQIIGTHLQNGGWEGLRHRQCAELFSRLIEKTERTGIPQIVCGDFNIPRVNTNHDYATMLELLDVSDGELTGSTRYSYDHEKNDLHFEPGHDGELIDYIFIRPNHAWMESVDRSIRILQRPWHSRHHDLSDHYPIEAEVQFQSPGAYTVSLSAK